MLMIVLILLAPAALLALRSALLVVTVEGESMAPGLRHGDRVLVARVWPRRWLRAGQVVIVSPEAGGPERYIKRIAGMPGARLESSLAELHEELRASQRALHDAAGWRHWLVPPGHCFVRGDAPLGGFDSLTWGPVPLKRVQGLVLRRLARPASPPAPLVYAAPAQQGPPIGAAAPHFRALLPGAGERSMASYAGLPLALVFIAPCEPCAELLPELERLAPLAERAGARLLVVSLASVAETRAFLARQGSALPVLLAPLDDNPMARDYRMAEWPYLCLIDELGIVVGGGYPSSSWGELHELAERWQEAEERRPDEPEPRGEHGQAAPERLSVPASGDKLELRHADAPAGMITRSAITLPGSYERSGSAAPHPPRVYGKHGPVAESARRQRG